MLSRMANLHLIIMFCDRLVCEKFEGLGQARRVKKLTSREVQEGIASSLFGLQNIHQQPLHPLLQLTTGPLYYIYYLIP